MAMNEMATSMPWSLMVLDRAMITHTPPVIEPPGPRTTRIRQAWGWARAFRRFANEPPSRVTCRWGGAGKGVQPRGAFEEGGGAGRHAAPRISRQQAAAGFEPAKVVVWGAWGFVLQVLYGMAVEPSARQNAGRSTNQ